MGHQSSGILKSWLTRLEQRDGSVAGDRPEKTRPAVMIGSIFRIGALSLVSSLVLLESTNALTPRPPIEGLVSMGDIRFHRQDGGVPENSLAGIDARPGIFSGVVINVTWAQLEGTRDRIDTKVIVRALATIRVYNLANPRTPLAVDLRVWPGPNAPDWIKNLGGPPVEIRRIIPGQPRQSITIGHFWSDAYRAAWSHLQHELAKKFDADPLIKEVTNTSCSSLSDEPFLIAADEISLANMRRAGFDDDVFRKCLTNSLDDYSGWRTTNVQFPLNPFRRTDSGRPILAPEVTFDVAKAFREALGSRAVVANYGLRSPILPWLATLYREIRELGPPIAFQAYSPMSLLGADGDEAIAYAISLGATEIELWKGADIGGFEAIPEDRLGHWSAALARQSPRNQ
jgi:hypothetical protein